MIFKSDGTGELNGFLDAGSHLQGELSFEDTFRVDGRITGRIVSRGDLVVGREGRIDGEIEVGRLFVSGRVTGRARAHEKIEIGEGGRVEAEISSPALVIEEGAYFEGRCSMERREDGEGREAAPSAAGPGPKLVESGS